MDHKACTNSIIGFLLLITLLFDCGWVACRVFDSLNYIENLKFGIEAVHEAGGVVEAVVCYTGDVSDPTKTKYDVDYYVNYVTELVECDIHILVRPDANLLLKFTLGEPCLLPKLVIDGFT